MFTCSWPRGENLFLPAYKQGYRPRIRLVSEKDDPRREKSERVCVQKVLHRFRADILARIHTEKEKDATEASETETLTLGLHRRFNGCVQMLRSPGGRRFCIKVPAKAKITCLDVYSEEMITDILYKTGDLVRVLLLLVSSSIGKLTRNHKQDICVSD